MKTYRVWIEQINAQMIDVRALNENDARDKAMFYARPKVEDMHVSFIEEQKEPKK